MLEQCNRISISHDDTIYVFGAHRTCTNTAYACLHVNAGSGKSTLRIIHHRKSVTHNVCIGCTKQDRLVLNKGTTQTINRKNDHAHSCTGDGANGVHVHVHGHGHVDVDMDVDVNVGVLVCHCYECHL